MGCDAAGDHCALLCTNGEQDQDEIGIDCGGSCANQDCCSNGYADIALGELGVDCGGSCGSCAGPTTYFVANDGDDDNTGTLPTSPWETIAKVNGSTFAPGDAILFRRGDTWRETLEITWSGSEASPLTFGAYGSGEKPRILGSERATDWTPVTGATNVWQSATALDQPYVGHPASIFFGELDDATTWGRIQDEHAVNQCGSGYSLLQQEYDWCWQSNTIYVYSPTDPDARYAFVEVPQRRGSITMDSHDPKEWITIDSLELMYGTMYGYNDGWPINYEVSGLEIVNCHIGYIGIQGGDSAYGLVIWHSDMLVRNNDIHDCGRRAISYNMYTDNGRTTPNLVFENVVFEHNYLHNGFHTTGLDIAHGDASAYPSTVQNFTIRSNFIEDDANDDPSDNPNDWTSMGIFLWPGSALYTNFKVHNNVLKNIKQKGFAFAGVDNLEVYNNVLYGMNPNIGVDYYPMISMSGDYANLRFDNNIIHGTVSDDPPDGFEVRCVYLGSGTKTVTSWNNNLYYQDDPTQPVFYISSPYGKYRMSDWADYLSDTGWDTASPTPQDPLFVDPENNDFRLRPDSPAIDAGTALAGRTTDFCDHAVDGSPDIGAFEHFSIIFIGDFESGDTSQWSASAP